MSALGRRPAATGAARSGPDFGRRRVFAALIVSVVLALLSLGISRTMGYDQEGWAIYARELFGAGALDTNSFPAWKPLPIVLIGPVTWFSHGQFVVDYWLLLARVCALMTVFGAAAVGHRFAGWWAAGVAAVLVVISPWWIYSGLLGLDAIPSAALVVGAVYAIQRGHHRWALLCLVGVSLLRPEGMIFVACFGVWAWRSGRIALWEVALAVLLVVGLWAVPDLLHSGKSSAALSDTGGTTGTPITTGHPFRATFTQAVGTLGIVPTVMVAVAACTTLWGLTAQGRDSAVAGIWGADGLERAMLAFGVGWILVIALETLHGFSGNSRYTVAGITALILVAAVTSARLGRLVVERLHLSGRGALAVSGLLPVVVVGTVMISAPGKISTGVDAVNARVAGVHGLREELAGLHCPGYYWGDPTTNTWLAALTGQSAPSSIVPRPLQGRLRGASIWKVWCAPADWRPHD